MGSGIYSALSGSIAKIQKLDTAVNNLANAGNIGYKASRLSFEALIQERLQNSIGVGMNYCRTASRFIDFSQGVLQRTGRRLDLAIEGDGFFKVAGPEGFFYTRRGNFTLDEQGALVTADAGMQVVGENGPVNLPHTDVHIDGRGRVTANGMPVGKIGIYGISDVRSLIQRPDGLFALDGNAKEKNAGNGRILQGALEGSNVSPLQLAVELIEIQRAYAAYLQTMKVYSHLGGKAIEIGRIG
ncbi:MAG: flagellar basal-body rod protein FlgF [Deltaproteobacteria bacterium]|nr:flagellar basal-body rod protein FlgF [Deltaproteobacteria bacterium]